MKKINEKIDNVVKPSKCGDPTITYTGEINIDAWARKIKQVLDDLEAGRYDKGNNKDE